MIILLSKIIRFIIPITTALNNQIELNSNIIRALISIEDNNIIRLLQDSFEEQSVLSLTLHIFNILLHEIDSNIDT